MFQTLSATTRELFIADEGNVFVECDLASAEGKTVALLSQSDKLLTIFREGRDVYCEIGTEMFGTPVKKGDKLRQLAKTSFLSLNYWAQVDTAFDMFWASEDVRKHYPNLTVRDVEVIRNTYMKVLPEIFQWGKDEQKACQKRGYYLCPWNGRRVPFFGPAELSMAANFPNQAGVAQWVCDALRKIYPRLREFGARMRTQVHDSLTVEVPEAKAESCAQFLKTSMEGTLLLHGRSVQMTAEYKIGKTLKDVK